MGVFVLLSISHMRFLCEFHDMKASSCVFTQMEKEQHCVAYTKRERKQVNVVYFIIFVFVLSSEHFSIFSFFFGSSSLQVGYVSSFNNKVLDIKLTRAPLSSSSSKLHFVFFSLYFSLSLANTITSKTTHHYWCCVVV